MVVHAPVVLEVVPYFNTSMILKKVNLIQRRKMDKNDVDRAIERARRTAKFLVITSVIFLLAVAGIVLWMVTH